MYQDEPRSKNVEVFGSAEAKDILLYTTPAYRRTIHTRPVTFTCASCGKTVTQERYPSPTPLYCSVDCRMEARRKSIKASVRRYRERTKQQEEKQ